MKRWVFGFAVLMAGSGVAQADVWMVKASDVLGCTDRDSVAAIDAAGGPSALKTPVPDSCVRLYMGERLIERPNAAAGFDTYIVAQRADGTEIYVPTNALTADPGSGSLSDDRPDQEP